MDPKLTTLGLGRVSRLHRIHHIGWFYIISAVLLVPWISYLVVDLPTRRISAHYNLAWIGFDAVLGCVLLTTGILAIRHRPAVMLTASAAAALLITDAWFDIVTASRETDRDLALLLAVIAEIPVAALSLTVAVRTFRRITAPAVKDNINYGQLPCDCKFGN